MCLMTGPPLGGALYEVRLKQTQTPTYKIIQEAQIHIDRQINKQIYR